MRQSARSLGGCGLALILCLCRAASALAQTEAAPPPGNFDFFVLSLSWSPGFCATAGSDTAPSQCAAGAKLGFVLHGLWPQFEHGFPTDCESAARPPSRSALDSVAGLFPDVGLARYEWRKHGSCTGEASAVYFAEVRRAHDEIVIPAMLQAPQTEQHVTPAALQRAFMDANPRLRPGMMAILCQKTILQDVRFCLTKDLRDFRTCPEVVRAACRSPQISVPPMR